jgi:hypothetical protein
VAGRLTIGIESLANREIKPIASLLVSSYLDGMGFDLDSKQNGVIPSQ